MIKISKTPTILKNRKNAVNMVAQSMTWTAWHYVETKIGDAVWSSTGKEICNAIKFSNPQNTIV